MRYEVKKPLPNLWEVRDNYALRTEFVLFGVYSGCARVTATEFALQTFDGRGEVLRMLAEHADREGLVHAFKPPRAMTVGFRDGV